MSSADNRESLRSPIRRFVSPLRGYVAIMPETNDISDSPITFDVESSKKARLDSSAFRGRVPVVFAFVGDHGPSADVAILNLDRSLVHFGEQRIQLLVVVDGQPSDVAQRLGVTVPLISDDGLAEELNAQVDDQRLLRSVVVGNDGRVLELVRHEPSDDQASAILFAVERLRAEFPDRFGVLPNVDENDIVERHDSPAREPGDADMSGSGIDRTLRTLAENEASDALLPEVDPEFASKEAMAEVREHYTHMTDEGASVKGEGDIDGVRPS